MNAYQKLQSFQIGGNITEDQKKELFPFFAYLYSQQLNPEKYGQLKPDEEWSSLISDDEDAINQITKAYTQLKDEDIIALSEQQKQYVEAQKSTTPNMQYAAKGTTIKKLQEFSKAKGGKIAPKKKKCSCGCDLISTKAEGGKIVETCSCKCGGKLKKKK